MLPCRDAPAAEPDVEIDPDVKTIADLPFHVMGRFPKPMALGRCRGDEVLEISSKEMFERIRDLSLGLRAPRRVAPAIASRSSPRAGPNGS